MLRITDARTGEPAEIHRALTRVHAQVPGDDTSALRVLLVADVLARALELGGSPVLLVADPPAGLRERADDLGIRPSEATGTRGGQRVLHVIGSGESAGGGHGHGDGSGVVHTDSDSDSGTDVTVEVAPVTGTGEPAATGTALRLALLSHPRPTPVTLDATALAEAAHALDHWRKAVAAWATRPSRPIPESARQALRDAWEDDLDVRAVLDVLRDVERARDVPDGARFETYAYADRLLGLELTREIGSVGMSARAGAGPLRRLVVLRHAKSAWPVGVPDHERPLAPRGHRDAPAAGRALAEADCLPDLAVCSTAVRARQTWELASAQWGTPPPVRHDGRVYAADVPELLDVVRETPGHVRTLLLVGPQPGAGGTGAGPGRRRPRRHAGRRTDRSSRPRRSPSSPGTARLGRAGPGHGTADGSDRGEGEEEGLTGGPTMPARACAGCA